MKSDMGLPMNIVLGIVGAAISSAIFSFVGIVLGGWIGYLLAGFIGACLLIWIVRALRPHSLRMRAAEPGIPSGRGDCYWPAARGRRFPGLRRRTGRPNHRRRFHRPA